MEKPYTMAAYTYDFSDIHRNDNIAFWSALKAYVILTAYIPMLVDTGGKFRKPDVCYGDPEACLLHELSFSDVFRVVWKEFA